MSEALEQPTTLQRSPLDATHEQSGATFAERDGWRVPASYGDTRGEYEAVRGDGAGLIDLSARGRISVSGAEALTFLNGLITNDVKTLAPGAWMQAAFPNPQGRLLAFARVLHRSDGSYLFDTETATHAVVLKNLARFTLAGDFRVTDETAETALLSLQGARAAELISATLGAEAANAAPDRFVELERNGERLLVMRATHTAEDGFDLLMSAQVASGLWNALVAAGARPFGFDALEVLRIEAGAPRYGADLDETNVVLESGLGKAVSFTKGCYVGQEIIARIHWRGHVAKRLAGLSFDGAVAVEAGAKVVAADGKEMGRVTSVTFSPRIERTIALAMIRYAYLAPGTQARVVTETGEHAARITALPFLRGSWPEAAANEETANA